MTMPSVSSSARPRAGKNAFRPRGASPEEPPMEASWAEMAGPLRYIYKRYWAEAKLLLAGVAVLVFLSSAAGIAAPYLFSRLIDALRTDSWGATIIWAFVAYGLLFGVTRALNNMVSYTAM